jgi:phage replication-related protein YjqB (UPF0714/DUF867 family)
MLTGLTGKVYPTRTLTPLTPISLGVVVSEVPAGYRYIRGADRFEREQVVVHPDLLLRTGLKRRQQIRLIHPITLLPALFTIVQTDATLSLNPLEVFIGPQAYTRLNRTVGDTPFAAFLTNVVAAPALDEAQAQAQGELREEITDDGLQSNMVILSPHGGDIETQTDIIARRMYTQLKGLSRACSHWGLQGYTVPEDPDDAFEKWHITSTDYYPQVYPQLSTLQARAFTYGISFHGLGVGDDVKIGGLASVSEQNAIVAVIDAATGPEVDVAVTNVNEIDGDSPRNLLNRLCSSISPHTIQVELGFNVRRDYALAIADALATYYDGSVF